MMIIIIVIVTRSVSNLLRMFYLNGKIRRPLLPCKGQAINCPFLPFVIMIEFISMMVRRPLTLFVFVELRRSMA